MQKQIEWPVNEKRSLMGDGNGHAKTARDCIPYGCPI
jgi:hypothetical protein